MSSRAGVGLGDTVRATDDHKIWLFKIFLWSGGWQLPFEDGINLCDFIFWMFVACSVLSAWLYTFKTQMYWITFLSPYPPFFFFLTVCEHWKKRWIFYVSQWLCHSVFEYFWRKPAQPKDCGTFKWCGGSNQRWVCVLLIIFLSLLFKLAFFCLIIKNSLNGCILSSSKNVFLSINPLF